MNRIINNNFAFAIIILIAACIGFYFYLDNANQGIDEVKITESVVSVDMEKKSEVNDGGDNSDLNHEDVPKDGDAMQEIFSILPEEVSFFKVEENGFNEDESLYSVNVYISRNVESKLKDSGLSRDDWHNYTGSWIVNLRNETAYRIASGSDHQDYIFNQWVENDKIELLGDGKYSATTYDAFSGDIISKRKFNLNTDIDVSKWSTYKNKDYGFEVKYPSNYLVEEVNKSFIEGIENRYVSFSNPDKDVRIFLGVKNSSEKDVSPRPFRTGIGSSEIFSRGDVAFGDGFANEKWLGSCVGNSCYMEEVWFCKEGDDAPGYGCDNIQLDNGQKEAYMGADIGSEVGVDNIQKLLGAMIRSFRAL